MVAPPLRTSVRQSKSATGTAVVPLSENKHVYYTSIRFFVLVFIFCFFFFLRLTGCTLSEGKHRVNSCIYQVYDSTLTAASQEADHSAVISAPLPPHFIMRAVRFAVWPRRCPEKGPRPRQALVRAGRPNESN